MNICIDALFLIDSFIRCLVSMIVGDNGLLGDTLRTFDHDKRMRHAICNMPHVNEYCQSFMALLVNF